MNVIEKEPAKQSRVKKLSGTTLENRKVASQSKLIVVLSTLSVDYKLKVGYLRPLTSTINMIAKTISSPIKNMPDTSAPATQLNRFGERDAPSRPVTAAYSPNLRALHGSKPKHVSLHPTYARLYALCFISHDSSSLFSIFQTYRADTPIFRVVILGVFGTRSHSKGFGRQVACVPNLNLNTKSDLNLNPTSNPNPNPNSIPLSPDWTPHTPPIVTPLPLRKAHIQRLTLMSLH